MFCWDLNLYRPLYNDIFLNNDSFIGSPKYCCIEVLLYMMIQTFQVELFRSNQQAEHTVSKWFIESGWNSQLRNQPLNTLNLISSYRKERKILMKHWLGVIPDARGHVKQLQFRATESCQYSIRSYRSVTSEQNPFSILSDTAGAY